MSRVGGLYSEVQVEHVIGGRDLDRRSMYRGGRGVVWKAGLGPCTGTPPWTGQTDTTENITFTTPLAGGDEIGLVQRASTTNCKYTIKRV